MGFSSEEAKKLVAQTQAQLHHEAEITAMGSAALHLEQEQEQANAGTSADPINQDISLENAAATMTQASTTLLIEMLSQQTQSTMLSQPHGPLPDSQYIISNQPTVRPIPLTTSTKAGKAATNRKRKVSTNKDGMAAKKSKSTTGSTKGVKSTVATKKKESINQGQEQEKM
ncbi:unnamed protein product [Urochloa humidicola]